MEYTMDRLEAMSMEDLLQLQADVMEAWDTEENVEPLIDLDRNIQVALEHKYEEEN